MGTRGAQVSPSSCRSPSALPVGLFMLHFGFHSYFLYVIRLVKSKLYLRKLAIKAVIRFANTNKLSFSDVAKYVISSHAAWTCSNIYAFFHGYRTVSSLITDYPIQSRSDAFLSIQGWLEEAVSADKVSELLGTIPDKY